MFNPVATVSKRLSRVHNFVLPTNLIDTNKCTSTKPMPKPNKARVHKQDELRLGYFVK
jgi:hypothetical protein